jgi:hypothetical protein
MKTVCHQKGKHRKSSVISVWGRRSATCLGAALASLAGLLLFGGAARADVGNQLVNPGWETGDNTGWLTQGNCGAHNATQTYYNAGMCPADPTAENINVYDGTYVGNVYGTFTAAVSYSFYQQSFATVAGSTWSASCFAYASHEDLLGVNNFCVDVAFLGSGGAVLAEYQSFNVTNLSCAGPNTFPLDTWVPLTVTNQIQNGVVIGTVPSGVLTAPAGTASVRYQLLFENVNYAGGSIYLDDAVLDLISGPLPPVISGLTPNNIILCNSNELSYTITSASGIITNAQVTAIMTGLPGTGISNNVTYGPGSTGFNAIGLGSSNVVVVTLALNTNTAYSVTVSGTDNNGVTATATDFFDTFQPVELWEAEDFNYNGGQWLTSVPANGGIFAYANLVGTEAIDELVGTIPSAGPHDYRPGDTVSIQGAYEQTPGGLPLYRQKFLDYFAANPGASNNASTVDEEVGYVNPGDWQDYTRNFPAGKYNVYARVAVSGAGVDYFEQVLSDPTQSGQTVTNLGSFNITGNNWNYYQYVPLLDQYGNLISVSLSGTQTVRIAVGPGSGANQNFFFVVPAVTIPKPILQSSFPTGVHPFEPTNHFTFTVGQGAGSAIPAGNVHLVLNGSDITAQVSFSSTATNWTGTIPVASNAVYSAVINVTNSTHLSSSYSISFDTFSQANYTFEAEDFDFNGGSFIDDPQPTADSTIANGNATGTEETNSYYAFPGDGGASIAEVDYHSTESGQSDQYRNDTPGTQVCGDYLRDKFYAAQTALADLNIADFNLGWYSTGTWLNYTRHYPAGDYNIYGRLAGGAGPFSGTTLSLVTSGWGTTTQTTNLLGSFADPNAAGWQAWHWVPLADANSNLVTVHFTGSTNTLKLTSGNNLNVNFLMLVPAITTGGTQVLTVTHNGSQVGISFATQIGHTYTVLYTSSLTSPVVWSTLTTIPGNGSTQSATDTISGATRFYRVSAQ